MNVKGMQTGCRGTTMDQPKGIHCNGKGIAKGMYRNASEVERDSNGMERKYK